MAVIDERPELYPDLHDVWEGFCLLQDDRLESTGRIPITAIQSYLSMFGTDDIERFVKLLRHLDREYVHEVRRRKK